MNENNLPVTLYPSRWKTFLALLVSLLFTWGGIWMISEGKWIGWLAAVFFGTGCITFTIVLLPGASHLRITEKGFEIRSLFKSTFTGWEEVESFKAGYIGPNKMVVFNFSPEHKKYAAGKLAARTLAGVEGALPDTYGKSAEALAELLNEWKRTFSAEQTI